MRDDEIRQLKYQLEIALIVFLGALSPIMFCGFWARRLGLF